MPTKYPKYIIFVGLFLVPFVPFLVSSAFFFPFITTKAFTFRIIVEVIFAAWLLLALTDTSYRPKKSIILYVTLAFLAVIGLADIFGVAPVKSFWSNFERMEGYITLLHLGMFFMVISSVFGRNDPASAQGSGEAMWKRWWNMTLVAAFLMVLYSVLQLVGLKTINQGGVRVDGTLGNAIYLAVYMLFHFFLALLFLWREKKNRTLAWVYGILALSYLWILYFTATRGAILGLLGGLLIIAILNVRNKEDELIRKTSIALLAGLLIVVGGFWGVRNTEFVTNSPVLSRFSSLTAAELKTQGRYFVWPIAFKGWQERPLLGWGQENFNYIFQKHYVPEMFRLEPWFDRAHNIFLDWMVVGGVLGLLAYLSLYVALLFSIWKPARLSGGGKDTSLPYTEKSILTGLIAAYFFHNFFVFDHLISYILFFSLLAYIHSRTPDLDLSQTYVVKDLQTYVYVKRVALPAVGILLVLSLYFVNIKPLMGNVFLIEALKSVQTPGRMPDAVQYFQKAYNAARLGRPEVAEHLAARAVPIFSSDLSMEEKNAFFAFAKEAVAGGTKDSSLEKDARYQLMAGSFLSTTGQLDEALAHLERARALMPGKQQMYLEIANVFLNKGDYPAAIETLVYLEEISPDHKEEVDGYIGQIEGAAR